MLSPQGSAHHATLVFERVCDAPIQTVFAAFADPEARERWGVPSNTAVLRYESAEFRVGGRDMFRCGSKTDPCFRGETHYLDIVENRRIVWSETIDADGKRHSISLVTVELEPVHTSTSVTLTAQVVWPEGPAGIEGFKNGYEAALDNLVRELHARAQ